MANITNSLYGLLLRLSKRITRKNLYSYLDQSINEISENTSEKLSILSVGSGGEVYEHLKKLEANHNLIQSDINENRKPDVVTDVCNMTVFEDNIFDVVFIIEVLEHVKEPQNAINEIHRVLKPNGRLILSVPYLFPIHSAPYDYYRFTKHGLEYLLRNYKQAEIKERSGYIDVFFVLLARMFITKDRKSRYVGAFIFLLSMLTYPLALLFSLIYKADHATMGYFVTANA